MTDYDIARFWGCVCKSEHCWTWLGVNSNSYGRFVVRRKYLYAHRVSWEMAHGAITNGLYVLHHCDNRNCIRPDHLFLGTAADNTADMIRKGRVATGERHGSHTRPESIRRGDNHQNSKLNALQVIAIRASYAQNVSTQTQLAKQFNVSLTCINQIIKRRKWAHV